MPYLDRFDYDIFISYSWASNINADQGDRQWIQDFRTELENELKERLGGADADVKILLDVDTPRNDDTETRFQNYIRRSAIFLAVVTPGFCSERSFCRKELDWFYYNSRPISRSPISIDSRLFKVEARPWAREAQPEKLRNLSPYIVYEGNPEPPRWERHRLLGVPAIRSQPGSRISQEFANLASALQAFLDTSKQSQLTSPIKTVFVAETTCSDEERQARFEIRQHETISQALSPGLSEADFRVKTAEMLTRSDCSLHLINTSEELKPPAPDWQHSVIENQLLCAQSVENPNFQTIVWCDSKRPIQDLHLKDLVEHLPKEFTTQNGRISLITQGIQSFTSNLPSLVARQPVNDLPIPPRPLGKRFVVQCVKEDAVKLRPALQKLKALGIGIQLPFFDGRRAERERYLKQFLEDADGTLIYWGSGGDTLTCQLCDKAVELYREVYRSDSAFEHKRRVVGIDPPDDVFRLFFSHPFFTVKEFPADPARWTEEQVRNAFL